MKTELTKKQIKQCRLFYAGTLVGAAYELAVLKNSIHPSNKHLEEAYSHLLEALKCAARVTE